MRNALHKTRGSTRRSAMRRLNRKSKISPHARLTAIDLFAGCGGATLGFKNVGFEVVAAVEVDSIAAQTYRMNHPGVLLLEEDIRKVSPHALLRRTKLKKGNVTIILGCPPCQGFSRVRRGGPDRRNGLVRAFAEFVVNIRPKFFILENVPGLVRGKGRRVFREALKLLVDIGYSVTYGMLNAADYGVPQRRKRAVVIGRHGGPVSLPSPTHCSPNRIVSVENHRPRLRPWVTVRETIGRLTHLSAGERDPTDLLHRAPEHSELALRRIRRIPKDGGSRSSLPNALVLDCHRDHDGHRDVYGRMRWRDVGPTITGGCDRVSKGRFTHPSQDRGITMREAALLQTFPKWYRFAGGRGAVALQIGNAVPVQFAKALARSVIGAYGRGMDRQKRPTSRHDVRARATSANVVSHETGRRQIGPRRIAHSPIAAADGTRRAATRRRTGRSGRLAPSKAAQVA